MFRTMVLRSSDAGRGRHVAGLLALLLTLSLLVPLGPARAAQDLPAQALQQVASETGLPLDQLSIVTRERATLPLSKLERVDFKVLATDGRTFGVSFNAATSERVDAEGSERAEQELQARTYGAIEPALYARLEQSETLAAGERIPVAIWLTHGLRPDQQSLPKGVDRTEQAIEAQADGMRLAQSAVIGALRIEGVEAAGADMAPLVFAELTPAQIRALARRSDVAAIEAIPQDLQNFNDDLGTSDRYTYAWPHSNGAGVKVAVHEDDGVDTSNIFLIEPTYWCSGVSTGPGGAACTKGRNIGGHATNVAGVIGSTHAWRRGGAYGLSSGSLLSANFQSFAKPQNIVNSLTWALAQGTDVVNMSWGGCTSGAPNFYSRLVDYLAKTYGDNLVISSGNTPNCNGSIYVAAPSLAWNSISVGSYYDNNSGLRGDDVFSSFTEWRNPTDPNTGRTYEKPDITAMGGQYNFSNNTCYGVETTGVGATAFNSTCGTSFSAPDAAALAALAISKDPTLRNRGEAVKAILMAGATHNITDNAGYRSCPSSPVANDCRDGAGAIDAYQTVVRIVSPGNWRYTGLITPDSFDAAGYISYPFNVSVTGVPIRGALAWSASATCSNLGTSTQACSTDKLNADLDLQLVNPSGTVVASSSSLQNSAEVIDYKPTVAGTYTWRIRKFRFDASTTTYAGMAWNYDTRDYFSPLTGYTPMTLNTTLTAQTNNFKTAYWDSYSGPGIGTCGAWRETGLEKVYRITTTKTGKITASLSGITAIAGGGAGTNLDVFILKAGGVSSNALNTQVVGCGTTSAVASAQPAGTYYVVVDGYGGSVANFSLKVSFI